MDKHRIRNRGNRRGRSGSSLLEYGMLGALITIACYTAMQMLGGSISQLVINSCTAISTAIQNAK